MKTAIIIPYMPLLKMNETNEKFSTLMATLNSTIHYFRFYRQSKDGAIIMKEQEYEQQNHSSIN